MMISTKAPWFSTTIMRGVVVQNFGGTEVLEIKRNVPIPKPKADEVLIKVAAAGVNPVDTYIRSGIYPTLPSLPYCPGRDVCGTIVFIGADVKKFKEGDRVSSHNTKSGAYAEFATAPCKHLIRLPDDFDFVKGAAVGTPYVTAYRALFQNADVKPGQTILIHGASGGVGLAATQLALSRGINVLGTAGSKEGIALVQENGVSQVFNHKEEGYTFEIMKATGGKGVDAIIEMLSNVNLNKDLEMVAKNGIIMVIGCRGAIEINPRLLMKMESKIKGVSMQSATDEELAQANLLVSTGLMQGWLNPVVGLKYSLNDVQKAHEDIIFNKGTKGKMILII